MKKIKDYSLYLILSQEFARQKDILEIASQAIEGGIDILQMREKGKSCEELIKLGNQLSSLCKNKEVIFIVNDDPKLAKEVNADGVHLGQQDIAKYTIEEARNILGANKIIGVSTHSLEEFEKANKSDCDYIAYGPIFPTVVKDYSIGIDDIEKVLTISQKPIVFIGGINLDNVDLLLNKGAKIIAAIRAFLETEDIRAAISKFKEKLSPNKQEVK
jgi:thiamine-phosphate pyrophosphorylase